MAKGLSPAEWAAVIADMKIAADEYEYETHVRETAEAAAEAAFLAAGGTASQWHELKLIIRADQATVADVAAYKTTGVDPFFGRLTALTARAVEALKQGQVGLERLWGEIWPGSTCPPGWTDRRKPQ